VVAAAEKVGNTANRKARTSPDRETILVFMSCGSIRIYRWPEEMVASASASHIA
jgi:hypothetical protein